MLAPGGAGTVVEAWKKETRAARTHTGGGGPEEASHAVLLDSNHGTCPARRTDSGAGQGRKGDAAAVQVPSSGTGRSISGNSEGHSLEVCI